MVDPAARDRQHLGDRVAGSGVDGVGGAHRPRRLELGRADVDGDDRRRTGDARRLHDVEAHAPAADHRHTVAGADLGDVEHRSQTGDDGAAEDRRQVERHVVVDADHPALVEDHLLGEPSHVGEDRDRPAVARLEARGLAGRTPGGGGVDAQARLARLAPGTRSAALHEARHDMIADGDRRDRLADLDHHARCFVAEHVRARPRERAVEHVQVAMAQATGSGAHPYLAGEQRGVADVLDLQPAGALVQDGGAHDGQSST